MALKVELKPGERFILGDSVLQMTNSAPVCSSRAMRRSCAKRIFLRPEHADSPSKKVYLIIQMMYLSAKPEEHHEMYFKLINDLARPRPA